MRCVGVVKCLFQTMMQIHKGRSCEVDEKVLRSFYFAFTPSYAKVLSPFQQRV